MNSDSRIEAASAELASRYRQQVRGGALNPDQQPADIGEALQVQQRVRASLGAAVGGWKCSLPTPEKTILAPLYAERISFADKTARCQAPELNGMIEIEPEIAYLIGGDLPPRATPYSLQEVLGMVASTHLVFELIGSRYADRTAQPFPSMLADRLANHGLFVGPAIASGASEDTALGAFGLQLTTPQGVAGQWKGKHPDGHPWKPLHWLANFLAANGGGLKRGEMVTTGSYHGVILIPAGVPVEMQFGTLGKLGVTVDPAR